MAASDPSPGRASESSGERGTQDPAGREGDRGRKEPAGGPGRSTVGAEVAARVEEIVRTAEHEAEVIRRDLEAHRRAAEEQAQRYLEDAKRQAEELVQSRVDLVRELTDELIEYANTTRQQVDALIAWLDQASERLRQEEVSLPPAPKPPWRQPGRPGPTLRPVGSKPPDRRRPETVPAPGPARPRDQSPSRPAAGGSPNLDAARLLAIEMAVSGHTREEVDAHLRQAFRFTDTAQLLDDVFGGGEPPKRWPGR